MQVNPEQIRLEPQADRSLRPPASGCLLPTVRQLDPLYLPIWNSGVLQAEWRRQLQEERAFREERSALTHKQLKAARSGLVARSLAGPLSRKQVAEAAGLTLQEIQQLAKDRGFWVRASENEMGQNPFQQLMFRLFSEYGEGYANLWFDFDDELQADARAQEEIEKIRERVGKPPDMPPQIGIWEVLSDPFLAVEKEFGLSWWVEYRCAAPGCKHRRSRWRPIKELRRSKAKRCQQHAMAGFVDLNDLVESGDAFSRMRRRHVPALLYGTPELAHPDMAQGALADYNQLLENPPSLKEPVAVPPPTLSTTTSLYYSQAPEPVSIEDMEAFLVGGF
jgi:hypothetical protein